MPNTETHIDPQYNISCPDLLSNVQALHDGAWFLVRGYDKLSIHFVISGSATMQICGSNETTPAANDDGVDLVAAGLTQVAIGTALTVSNIIHIKGPIRWIKVKVTAWTSGPVNAMLEAL